MRVDAARHRRGCSLAEFALHDWKKGISKGRLRSSEGDVQSRPVSRSREPEGPQRMVKDFGITKGRLDSLIEKVIEKANSKSRQGGSKDKNSVPTASKDDNNSAKKAIQRLFPAQLRKCLLKKPQSIEQKRNRTRSDCDRISLLNSPFKLQEGSLDLKHTQSINPRRKKLNSHSAADVHSARTSHNGPPRYRAELKQTGDLNLLQREFNLNRFKGLFGKIEQRRRTNEGAKSVVDMYAFKNSTKSVLLNKKHLPAGHSKDKKKSRSKENPTRLKRSHRGQVPTLPLFGHQPISNSQPLVQNVNGIVARIKPKLKKPVRPSDLSHVGYLQDNSKSKDSVKKPDSHRSYGQQVLQPDFKKILAARFDNATTAKRQGGSGVKKAKIVYADTMESTEGRREGLESISHNNIETIEDMKFLFNKKLSNLEKMSLLKLRKTAKNMYRPSATTEPPGLNSVKAGAYTLEEAISSRDKRKRSTEKSLILPVGNSKLQVEKLNGYELARFVKGNRLATRMSASDSNNTHPKLGLAASQVQIEMSLSNAELEADLEAAHSSFGEKMRQASSKGKKVIGIKLNISRRESPVNSKPRLSKKLFGRRKSFCEERPKDKLIKEIPVSLKHNEMSMTSGTPLYEEIECGVSEETEGYFGGSELQRSNSEVLLRSMVSASSNAMRSDHSSMLAKVEVERANLIAYIKDYCKKFNQIPRTTLQFYKVLRLIGKGSFGKVHLGLHLLTRKKVAIKCIDKQYIIEEKAQSKIVQEVSILKLLNHSNIVKILEVFENRKYVFIITDYASRGDLLQYMKEHGVFKETKSKPIVAQILNGLEFCHGRGILHRDVKLDNILLDKDMKVRLCDFGVSRQMPKNGATIKERCGTPAYIAPEIIKNQGYSNFSADVFSCDSRCGR